MPLLLPVLEHLAGLTASIRPSWEIRLINANVEEFSPDSLDADMVGISILTHQSSWAYRAADVLRFSHDILKEYGATAKMLTKREDALKKIRDNGIDVVLFVMLGSKDESLDEYDRVIEVCDRLAITPHPSWSFHIPVRSCTEN
ncbi:MAG: hypothetical protein PVSMB11_10760 [Desulfuromonadaceae bacterium]